MASKDKEYDNALGSIYDFIFAELEKEPSKRKPVKLQKGDFGGDLSDALFDVMAMPGMFVTNETMKAFKDLGDIEIFKQNVGTRQSDSLKIKVSDLPDIIKDPNKWVDKKFATMDAIRKKNRMAWAGELMMGVNAGAVARQAGLDTETQYAMTSAAHTKTGRSDYMSANMRKRNQKLLEKYKGRTREQLERELGYFYDTATAKKQADSLLKTINGYNIGLDDKLSPADKKKYERLLKNKVISGDRRDAVKNKSAYQFLEMIELRNKSLDASVRAGGATTPEEKQKFENQAQGYKQMGNALVTLNGIGKNAHGFGKIDLDQMKKDRATLQDRIREARRNGSDRSVIRELREEKSRLDDSYNVLRRYKMAGDLGNVEGIYNTLKDYTTGGLVPALITLDFYDKNRNQIPFLLPLEEKNFEFKNSRGEVADLDMMIAKVVRDKDGKRNTKSMSGAYYKAMEGLYYMTPTQIAKGMFYDGSTYVYSRYKRSQKLGKELFKDKEVFKEFEKLLRKEMKKQSDDALKMYDKFLDLNPEELQELIDKLGANDKFAKKFEKFYKQNERLSNRAYVFGSVKRMQKKVTDFFVDRTRGIREGMKDFLGGLGVNNDILDIWVKDGGFGVIARELVEGALKKILQLGASTTLGPAAAFLFNQLINLGTNLVMKLAKPMTKVVLNAFKYVALVLLFGLASVFFLLIPSIFSAQSQHANVAPDQITYCDAYTGISPIIDDPFEGGDLGEFIADSLGDENCLLGSASSYRCSQGVFSSDGFSHHNVAANDYPYLGNFYAPKFCGDGNCVVKYSGNVSCYDSTGTARNAGGMLIFDATYGGTTYTFKLIHVIPGYSVGDSLPSGASVATIISNNDLISYCSTGAHLHLETSVNGTTVDPYEVMTGSTENGGFECPISECPQL